MSLTARIALTELRDLRAEKAAYDADCAEWAKQGYRPHYCIHGTDRWTDYDNICGPCEDGLSLHQIAVRRARDIVHDYTVCIDALMVAVSAGYPREITDQMRDYALNILYRTPQRVTSDSEPGRTGR